MNFSAMFASLAAIVDGPTPTGPQPLTLHTPVRYDPGVLSELARSESAIRGAFDDFMRSVRGLAAVEAERSAAAMAASLRQLHREEAIQVYPVLASRFADDPEVEQAVSEARQDQFGLVRQLLRLVENILESARHQLVLESDLYRAEDLLLRYFENKQQFVYAAYRAAVEHVSRQERRAPALLGSLTSGKLANA